MITPFASTSSGTITATAFSAATLYARSSNASDTGTLTASGLDESSAAETEVLALTGKREVASTDQFTKLSAAILSGAQTGAVTLYKSGTAAVGLIIVSAQPSDGDTVTIGLTGFTQAYTFKNTLASAYDVKIGASATETAENLRDAINDSAGVEGTDYGTGTAPSPYLTATVSGVIITVTDRIPCLRSLAWSFAKSGTNLSVSAPTGGVDGTLLATISASATAVYNAISLDDEGLTLGLLPPLIDWTSDAVRVSGKRFSIHVSAENVTTGMATSYQYSTEATPTVWRAGVTSISNLDNNVQIITPVEVVENIRLSVNNTNTWAASVNAKVCRE